MNYQEIADEVFDDIFRMREHDGTHTIDILDKINEDGFNQLILFAQNIHYGGIA